MPVRSRTIDTGLSYRFQIIDDQPTDYRDIYHWLLRLSWPRLIGLLFLAFLAVNVLFGTLFHAVGGVANRPHERWLDDFFFSVQTFGTIGYGAMYPASDVAGAVMVAESFTSLLLTAMATGLVFVRFSRVRARVRFCKQLVVTKTDGVLCLIGRVGNARSNRIHDAAFEATMVRTVRTAEGELMYRTERLPLVRDSASDLLAAFQMIHRIDEKSPLFGATPDSMVAQEVEISLGVTGVDETTLQAVHARHTWEAREVRFDARMADMLTSSPSGDLLTLDLRRFDEVLPSSEGADRTP